MRATAKRIGIAGAAAVVALLLKLALDPVAAQSAVPFVLFPAAVMVAAWYGGFTSGAWCTLFSAFLSDFFFSSPRFTLWVEQQSQQLMLIEFIAEGIVISVLAGALHRARRESRRAIDTAESAQRSAEEAADQAERAEAARELSDVRFQTLVDANVVGVFVADQDGKLLDANDAFLQMLDCTREQLECGECNWREMTPDEYQAADDRALEQVAREGWCTPYEKSFSRRDGSAAPVLLGGAMVDPDGTLIGVAADMSQQKSVERELAAAKEVAEAANVAKNHFLANISHELRTPMNAILGMTELALDEELPPLAVEYLETVKSSADSLLYLLNDLLDFSRMETGTFELVPEPFNVRETLDEAAKALSLRAAEKGLELACYIHSQVPTWIEGDGRRLRQIITNLIANAIKFTEVGEVVVSATVESTVNDVVSLEFIVSDTGVGIAPDDQEKIFAPFTQADASTTRRHTGSGLGLAICQQLAEKMGGRIRVDSTLGEGSRFRCTIPFQQVAPPGAEPGSDDDAPRLNDVPVLVVDDNATNRRILNEMLANWSMNPSVVESAKAALEALENGHRMGIGFPLVIVDALMPNTDGLMLIEEAQRRGVLRGATVLMLSSADRTVFQDRCNELRIDNFLEKPVSQSDLLRAVQKGLGGPEPDRQVRRLAGSPELTLRVLVAEDTPANQKLVEAILSKRGHAVEIAHNGRDAIELHLEQDFDVILMDVQMPTMDGYQSTRVIRDLDDEAKSNIPIIAMTAHAMDGDQQRCLAAGMDAYIAKPLNAAKLVRLVEKQARKRSKTSWPLRDNHQPTDEHATDGRLMMDREAVLRRLGGDHDLLQDLVRLFHEDAPRLLDKLELAITTQDDEAAARSAHSLKGLVANFGAQTAVALASEAEALARQKNWSPLHLQMTALRASVAALLNALRSLVDGSQV